MRLAAIALLALGLTACGGHKAQSPEQVARAWSAALDRSDDKAAGALFAANAEIVQNGTTTVLHGAKDALEWNRALPCGGSILAVTVQARNEVLVVFRLNERPGHACDGPDEAAAAVFRVVDGKITLWHQVPPPTPGQTI